MLPSLVAEDLRASLTSFLGTTFALGDDDVSAELESLDWVFENQPESEAPILQGRERSLFYVACSRARDELVVTWSGAPSPFIPSSAARV